MGSTDGRRDEQPVHRDKDPAKSWYVQGGGGFYSVGFRCAKSSE